MIREDKCSFTQYFQTHANWVIYCSILNDNSRILFITYDVGVFFLKYFKHITSVSKIIKDNERTKLR